MQAPIHGRLVLGVDAEIHRRLVRSNWARTVAWGLRALVARARHGTGELPARLGHACEASFSPAFKREMGMLPGACRRVG